MRSPINPAGGVAALITRFRLRTLPASACEGFLGHRASQQPGPALCAAHSFRHELIQHAACEEVAGRHSGNTGTMCLLRTFQRSHPTAQGPPHSAPYPTQGSAGSKKSFHRDEPRGVACAPSKCRRMSLRVGDSTVTENGARKWAPSNAVLLTLSGDWPTLQHLKATIAVATNRKLFPTLATPSQGHCHEHMTGQVSPHWGAYEGRWTQRSPK